LVNQAHIGIKIIEICNVLKGQREQFCFGVTDNRAQFVINATPTAIDTYDGNTYCGSLECRTKPGFIFFADPMAMLINNLNLQNEKDRSC
jgi:hypothetical protein